MDLELIDRNLLILKLKQLEVSICGFIRPSRANYFREAVEEFICSEIVDLVREQPFIKLDENLQEKIVALNGKPPECWTKNNQNREEGLI